MNSYKNMLVNANTPFAIGEAFKEIRTNMLYTARDVRCPVYAVTSAFAHAGKSVVTANLAASFAGLGKRVLILDADLRNPAQQKIFGTDRSLGVSEIAAGICLDADAAILMEEKDLTPERIANTVRSLYEDADARRAMEESIAVFGNDDAEKRIYEEIQKLLAAKATEEK